MNRRNARKGPIAQRLEQSTHNALVPGSNPGGPTRTNQIELSVQLRYSAQRGVLSRRYHGDHRQDPISDLESRHS